MFSLFEQTINKIVHPGSFCLDRSIYAPIRRRPVIFNTVTYRLLLGPPAMPDPQLLAFTAVIFLFAGSIKGVIGVGLPTVAVGLMTAFVGLHEAVQLVVVPAFLTNVWQGAMGGQFKMLVRRLWPLLMASCLGTWVGASILVAIEPRYLSGTLGGLLAAYSFYSLLTPQIPPPGRWEKALNPVMGFLAGIATGCVASFVMPGALYLQALGLTRDALVQAMGIAFTVVTAAQAVSLTGHGMLGPDMGMASAMMLIPAAAGMIGGQMIRRRLPAETFRRVFFFGLLLLGAYLVFRSFF